MASFLKVLFQNLLDGPSTDPFPLGETFTPERLRGKCVIDPNLCVGCGICKRVCAAGAIDITPKADKSGYTITVWRNSCCLCASCRHYCPTGAMSVVNDWHSAHPESEKYECIEQHTINYDKCDHCGAYIRPLPPKLAKKLYVSQPPEVEAETVQRLCSKCRQLQDARRAENKGGAENGALAQASEPGEVINMNKAPEKAPENSAGSDVESQAQVLPETLDTKKSGEKNADSEAPGADA